MLEKYNKDLKLGDILLFKGSIHFKASQYMIKAGGLLSHQKHGHYDTIHAGVCIGHDEDGRALMAHVSRSKKGFTIETVDDMFIRDNEKRIFYVFRPDEPSVANMLVATIKEHAQQIKTYGMPESITAGFTIAKKNKKEKGADKYSENNFCSKFIFETLEMATRDNSLLEKYSPTLKANSTPKDLESYLTKQHGQYERLFCNPNNNEGLIVSRNKAAEEASMEMKDRKKINKTGF